MEGQTSRSRNYQGVVVGHWLHVPICVASRCECCFEDTKTGDSMIFIRLIVFLFRCIKLGPHLLRFFFIFLFLVVGDPAAL